MRAWSKLARMHARKTDMPKQVIPDSYPYFFQLALLAPTSLLIAAAYTQRLVSMPRSRSPPLMTPRGVMPIRGACIKRKRGNRGPSASPSCLSLQAFGASWNPLDARQHASRAMQGCCTSSFYSPQAQARKQHHAALPSCLGIVFGARFADVLCHSNLGQVQDVSLGSLPMPTSALVADWRDASKARRKFQGWSSQPA